MEVNNTAITRYQNYNKIVDYSNSPEVMGIFTQVLGREAPYYVQSAIMAVKSNERLMECTPRSIFNAALRAATLRLSCDPALGHAFLVPYKNKGILEASFQPGWKGIQHMALRTGKYRYINVADVWEGETVEEDRFTGDLIIKGDIKSPKKTIGLIATFKLLAGMQKSIFMTNEEFEEHGRRYSKSYNRSDSIWQTNKPAAYHKTIVLKLLRNYGYISPLEASILNEDEQQEISSLEMPEYEEVTIEEKPTPSMKQVNRTLGYRDDSDDDYDTQNYVDADYSDTDDIPPFVVDPDPEPVDETEPADDIKPFTIEDACKVTNSKGVQYGTMTIITLEKMLSALWKQLKENHLEPEEKAEIERKIKAAQVVLAAKRTGEIN